MESNHGLDGPEAGPSDASDAACDREGPDRNESTRCARATKRATRSAAVKRSWHAARVFAWKPEKASTNMASGMSKHDEGSRLGICSRAGTRRKMGTSTGMERDMSTRKRERLGVQLSASRTTSWRNSLLCPWQ